MSNNHSLSLSVDVSYLQSTEKFALALLTQYLIIYFFYVYEYLMKLIDRYILNSFLWNFAGIIFICLIVFLVYMLIDAYEDILANSPPLYYVVLYFLNSLPFLLIEVMPLAVAIAVLLTCLLYTS
ncbi:MAG: LptF/LptG family permease, partial [Candidatus Sumerlaeia bacterium]|nr:LptF/LptG family permease [Candidatus Sumerlaeia bacterium]